MKEIGTFIWKKNRHEKDIHVIFCNNLGHFVYRVIRREGRKRLKITWRLLEDLEDRWGDEPDIDNDYCAKKFRSIQNRCLIGDHIYPENKLLFYNYWYGK